MDCSLEDYLNANLEILYESVVSDVTECQTNTRYDACKLQEESIV